MPISGAELRALGCPSDDGALDTIEKWLEEQGFESVRDLRGVGDVSKLPGKNVPLLSGRCSMILIDEVPKFCRLTAYGFLTV